MALLGFLLESVRQRAERDVQTLCLSMSISNEVTERYVETNPEDVQIKQRLMHGLIPDRQSARKDQGFPR